MARKALAKLFSFHEGFTVLRNREAHSFQKREK